MAVVISVTHRAPSCSERELVAAVRHGEERAFDELYSRYRSRIRSYIFGMVGDHARAEDIAQEVFISALRRLRATDHPIAFKPWLYEIAKNACIDEFRRTKRSREVPLEPDNDGADLGATLPSTAPSADAAFESKVQLDDLRGAFGGLSEQHHKILVLRELEGLSYDEIGARMDMSRAMVESTLFRARRRLSEEYQELVSGRRCQEVQSVIERTTSRSARSIRIRQRRQLARHLSHCQPCRKHARLMGFDESILKTPSIAQKIAALLPIPWLRWRRSGSGGSTGGADSSLAAAPYQFSPSAVQTVATFANPTAPSFGFARVAAAAAAVVIAGTGGGIVSRLTSQPAHGAPSRAAGTGVGGHGGSGSGAHAGRAGAGGGGVAGSAAGGPGAAGGGATAGTGASHSSSTRPNQTANLSSSGSSSAGTSGAGGSPGRGSTAGGGVPGVSSVTQPVGQILQGVAGSSGVGSATGAGAGTPSLPTVGVPSLPPVSLPSVPQGGLPTIPPIGVPTLPPVSAPTLPAPTLPPLPRLGLPKVSLP